MKQDYLMIGEIVKPQGIRGELKVRSLSDDPARFEELTSVFLEMNGQRTERTVLKARVQGQDVYLTLQDVPDRNAAELLRGATLWVDRDHARVLSEDEVFIADILGARAVDTKGNPIGVLREVMPCASADIFCFETEDGSLMVPALKTVLLDINVEEGIITLDEDRLSEVGLYEGRHS